MNRLQKPKKAKAFDYGLLIVVLVLIVVGLYVLYSTSSYNGQIRFHDRMYYLKKQLFATSIGLACMYAMASIDYHVWQRFAIPAYVLSLILSFAVLFIGEEINGSKRWLSFGPLSFQPSEFAKLAVILLLAHRIEKQGKHMKRMRNLIWIMAMLIPIVALVGSNNLSTAIIILGIGVVLVFVASPMYAQFVWIGVCAIGFMAIFLATASYRLERLAIWRHPELYEKGYQTLQGLYAIGSGGLFGRGSGESIQKLGFVPEAQNDMIFAIVCEEWGLVGAGFLILLFGLLIWRFFVIAVRAKDLFGTLIATGAMAHMMIQVILNIAVVTNTIPNTGITLPFVSYGGTSILFLLTEIGLVLNVSHLIE